MHPCTGRRQWRFWGAYSRIRWHLRYEKKPFRWCISRFLWGTGLGRFFTIDCDGYRIRFFRSSLSLSLWTGSGYGRDDRKFLAKILNRGDWVVDIGANIGTTTLASAILVGENGRVISIEPHPRIFAYLVKNIKLNQLNNILAIHRAVGEKSGDVLFSNDRLDDQNKVTSEKGLRVALEPLDKLLSNQSGFIRLLKVDVEGYEMFVFRGADHTLRRSEYLFFEVDEQHFALFGYTTRQLLTHLSGYGFRFFYLDPTDREVPVSVDFVPPRCMNLIAHRGE